jgi:ABC-2 type transport system permease protein
MSDLYLLRGALFDGLRLKRLLGAALLAAVPALICLLWRGQVPAEFFNADNTYNNFAEKIVFSFTLTLLCVVFASGVVSLELEQKTIVYLLTRPVPRWRILLTRFLGKLVIVIALCWLSTALLAASVYYPGAIFKTQVLTDLKALALGALTYGCLFLMLATLATRPVIIGVLFSFGWETWVPLIPGEFKRFSVMTYLRALAPRAESAPQSEADGFVSKVVEKLKISEGEALNMLLFIAAVSLLAAFVVFSRREYAPREDGE